jgi:hypothetical protein
MQYMPSLANSRVVQTSSCRNPIMPPAVACAGGSLRDPARRLDCGKEVGDMVEENLPRAWQLSSHWLLLD